MMRRAATILISLLLLVAEAAAQVDSTRLRELDSRLQEYFSILEPQPFEVKAEECDALIGAAKDSTVRNRIALWLYDHYMHSTLMGDEAVAIHLTDRWFSTGEIDMGSDTALIDAKVFADFNRRSLLGMKAPEVTLSDPFGGTATIPVILSEAKDLNVEAKDPHTRYQLLYFHDTDCPKCKLETATLRSFLDDTDYPLDVIAVYVGRDEEAWKEWRERTFVLREGTERVSHLWDPDDESGYQMKYAVNVTPRMFLLSPEGIIIGRCLDTPALVTLLGDIFQDSVYQYGGEESAALFDELFSTYGRSLKAADVSEVAAMISSRTIERGDTLSYKHLEGDLLYYLASNRTEALKEGTLPFIDTFILSRPDVWNTDMDTLQVIGMAEMNRSLLSKTPVGSIIPKMSVKGWKSIRRKGGFLVFHSPACPVCKAELAAAEYLHLAYLPIDMSAMERNSPETARELLDKFDLSTLPQIIQVGKKGVVKRRYLSLSEHLLFLDEKD